MCYMLSKCSKTETNSLWMENECTRQLQPILSLEKEKFSCRLKLSISVLTLTLTLYLEYPNLEHNISAQKIRLMMQLTWNSGQTKTKWNGKLWNGNSVHFCELCEKKIMFMFFALVYSSSNVVSDMAQSRGIVLHSEQIVKINWFSWMFLRVTCTAILHAHMKIRAK